MLGTALAMSSSIEDLIDTVNAEVLTPLVRQAQDNPALEVLDWRCESLAGGSTKAKVYRVSGSARATGQPIPWSFVLKILPAPSMGDTDVLAPNEDPHNSTYWKREFLVYESGLLDGLPHGFGAPHCFRAEEIDGVCWLWLEDLGNLAGGEWSREQFAAAARHLGLFNEVWLAGRGLPSFDWLSTSLVRERAYMMDTDEHRLPDAVEALCQNPKMRPAWSDSIIASTRQLLAERQMFLGSLDRLPKTFQHQDAGRKNLFNRPAAAGAGTTLAIDWGFAGLGAVGGELASLVSGSARWFGDVHPAQLPEMEEAVFEGYLQGLSEAGWHGDRRAVRLGYLLTSCLMFAPTWMGALGRPSDNFRAQVEAVFRRPFQEVAWRWSEVNQHIVALAAEARALM
jgi:hypothetical protein